MIPRRSIVTAVNISSAAGTTATSQGVVGGDVCVVFIFCQWFGECSRFRLFLRSSLLTNKFFSYVDANRACIEHVLGVRFSAQENCQKWNDSHDNRMFMPTIRRN